MRRITYALITLALLVAAPAFAAKELDGVTLNISSFGGAFDEVLKTTVAAPLKEKYGLTVVYHPATGLQSIAKVMAAKDNPPLDVLMIDSPSMPTVIEGGIVEPISRPHTRAAASGSARRAWSVRDRGRQAGTRDAGVRE